MVVAQTQPVPVNVYETTGALVVVAPLPAVMSEDIELELEPGRLTIRAEMRSPAPKDYLIHEWHYGPYERTLEIPEGFGSNVTATHGNGQLAVSLEKGAPPSGSSRTYRPTHHP